MADQLDYKVEEHRRAWVDWKISSLLGKEHCVRHSELGQLLDGVTKAAALQAVRLGHHQDGQVDRWGQSQFDRMLEEASAPIENLRYVFLSTDDDTSGKAWSHKHFVLSDVRAKSEIRARIVPQFQRQEIEALVGSYIDASVKSAEADRIFIDLLVAMEFYQFADSVLNAPHLPVIAPSLLKRRPILDWFFGRIVSAFCGLFGFALFWLASKFIFPERWLWIVGLILVCLFLVEAAWALVVLPAQWIAVRKAQKRISEALAQMDSIYRSLSSDGPISAQHITELVKKSTEAGIVWPAPLHVLLEDILARGGRF